MLRRSKRKRSSELTFAGWKIVKKSKQHFDHTYKEGLNIDKKKFNPSGHCKEGGLYFASTNVLSFLFLYQFNDIGTIHRVYTYPDSQVYHENEKSKTDKFWLDEGFDLSIESTWKMMFENGIDVRSCDAHVVSWAACKGHLPVLEFLFEKGADIHVNDDDALCWAAVNGHLSVVKFLFEQGANISDVALRRADINGHLSVVKFLSKSMQ
jgi:hypothetical protein